MGKPTVRFGPMPVLHFRRDDDDCARLQADRFFSFFLIPSASGRTDENLTAAGFGMMDVPVVAAARLKGDICKAYNCLLYTSRCV